MCQYHGKWQKLFRFTACIPRHDSLISGSHFPFFASYMLLSGFHGVLNTLCDIRALLMDQGIKEDFSCLVSDFFYYIFSNRQNIRLILTCNFPGQKYRSLCCKYLTGYSCFWIPFQTLIQDTICNQITEFIRMPFCYRFRCIKSFHIFFLLSDKNSRNTILTAFLLFIFLFFTLPFYRLDLCCLFFPFYFYDTDKFPHQREISHQKNEK